MNVLNSFYDIREIKSQSMSLVLDNGHIEKPKFEKFKGKFFRVLKNGHWGYYSGNVKNSEGLKLAEKNSKSISSNFASNSSVIVNEDVNKSESYFELKPKICPCDISIDEKISLLREIEKNLRYDWIVSTKIIYMENLKDQFYIDSCGCEVSYSVPRTGLIIQAVAKNHTLVFYSKRILKPAGYEIVDKSFEKAKEVVKVLKELLKAKTPPSGEMNVVMDPVLSGVFIHEAFGHAAEADHILQGASILADKIGEKVASENVTICDNPLIKEFGFYPFDDEGIKAKKRVIVDKGTLVSYMHSRETAAKLGGIAGNARAQATSEPIVRMSNTYIEAGDYTFEELLEEARDGIFLSGTRGGETNPATGYFQFSAQYGYIIKNGELHEVVKDVALSGNTMQILKEIKLGKDLEFDPGFCGKAGQLVPVSDGSPHALIKAWVGGG